MAKETFNFSTSEYIYLSKMFNRYFRVKVGSRLVGWTGFVLSLGYERAKAYLLKALRIVVLDKFSMKLYSGSLVTFYCK